MPSTLGADLDRGVAGEHAGADPQLGHARPPRRAPPPPGQRERSAHRALGVVLARHRRAPDRHHGVADELLDRAAVALDQRAAALEVLAEELADVLGVAVLGQRGEADQVGEQHRDQPPLGDRGRGCGRRRLPGVSDQRCRRTRHRSDRPARSGRRSSGRRTRARRRTGRRSAAPRGSRLRRRGTSSARLSPALAPGDLRPCRRGEPPIGLRRPLLAPPGSHFSSHPTPRRTTGQATRPQFRAGAVPRLAGWRSSSTLRQPSRCRGSRDSSGPDARRRASTTGRANPEALLAHLGHEAFRPGPARGGRGGARRPRRADRDADRRRQEPLLPAPRPRLARS